MSLMELDRVTSPPLSPVEPAIDLEHLARMTMGERSLEREVLALFDRQAEMLLARIREDASTASAAAHTLKGSALGIGAWRVADAAEVVERPREGGWHAAVERLSAAVDDAKAAIAQLLIQRPAQQMACD